VLGTSRHQASRENSSNLDFKTKKPDCLILGNPAISYQRPVVFRPQLTLSLAFSVTDNYPLRLNLSSPFVKFLKKI
jgi:hypothetical protein